LNRLKSINWYRCTIKHFLTFYNFLNIYQESTGADTANNVSVRHGGTLETEAESPEMDQLMV
jgi:hypothetical protein